MRLFTHNFMLLLCRYKYNFVYRLYEIESRVETPMMFRYPLFEALHWYAAAQLLTVLRRHNEETQVGFGFCCGFFLWILRSFWDILTILKCLQKWLCFNTNIIKLKNLCEHANLKN